MLSMYFFYYFLTYNIADFPQAFFRMLPQSVNKQLAIDIPVTPAPYLIFRNPHIH